MDRLVEFKDCRKTFETQYFAIGLSTVESVDERIFFHLFTKMRTTKMGEIDTTETEWVVIPITFIESKHLDQFTELFSQAHSYILNSGDCIFDFANQRWVFKHN